MTATPLERLARFFATQPTRQGLLARAELCRPGPDDAALRERLAAGLGAELRPDGSASGGTLPAVWHAHQLLDLATPAAEEPLRRSVQWVLHLQGRPGAYGEGCDRERHTRHLCEHYVAGFFSPGPVTERITPVTFPNGKVFRAEPAARFAISCLALRAVLRAGHGACPPVRRHVDTLAALTEQWSGWGGYFPPDLIVMVMLALAAGGAERREVVTRLAALAAAHQQEDGGWPNTDFFHALEGLRAAGTDAARAAVARALPALLARQRPDGSFGPTAQQERALIGLRALLWAGDAL